MSMSIPRLGGVPDGNKISIQLNADNIVDEHFQIGRDRRFITLSLVPRPLVIGYRRIVMENRHPPWEARRMFIVY
jgi:hypothetical protein